MVLPETTDPSEAVLYSTPGNIRVNLDDYYDDAATLSASIAGVTEGFDTSDFSQTGSLATFTISPNSTFSFGTVTLTISRDGQDTALQVPFYFYSASGYGYGNGVTQATLSGSSDLSDFLVYMGERPP